MTPRRETLVVTSLAFALVGGLVVFSCIRDATAHRMQHQPITVPLRP